MASEALWLRLLALTSLSALAVSLGTAPASADAFTSRRWKAPRPPFAACGPRLRPEEFAAVAFAGGAALFPGAFGEDGAGVGCFGGAAAVSGWLKGCSRKSQSADAEPGAMETSRLVLSNPNISTAIVQAPSLKSGKL
jgi:hypothetical protein